jgi:two-component system LytT family response regulator
VPVGDLVWIEADGSYARLHTASGTMLHRESLDSLARRLDPTGFIRVHRSAIVAKRVVRHVLRSTAGVHNVVLTNGKRVRASRAGWQLLRDALE